MRSSQGPVRVLMVEDNSRLAEQLGMILERHGYEVKTALTAEEGFDLLKEWNPDLVILDIMLPRKDGYDFIRDIRRQGLQPPKILMITAHRDMEELLRVEVEDRKWADDYLLKPIPPQTLLDRVARLTPASAAVH